MDSEELEKHFKPSLLSFNQLIDGLTYSARTGTKQIIDAGRARDKKLTDRLNLIAPLEPRNDKDQNSIDSIRSDGNSKESAQDTRDTKGTESSQSRRIKVQDYPEFEKLKLEKGLVGFPFKFFTSGMLIQLFAGFDTILHDLFEISYKTKPDLIKKLDIKIGLEELVQTPNVDLLKNNYLTKEIDACLFGDYQEILNKLFSLGGGKLQSKSFRHWDQFYRASQDRHVMVHASGKISQLYIKRCEDKGIRVEQNLGDDVQISLKSILSDIRVVQCIVYESFGYLMSKLHKDEGIRAVASIMQERIFNLLVVQENETAWMLSEYLISEYFSKCPTIEDRSKRINVINAAQSLKWLQRQKEALDLINKYDWSMSDNSFKLCLFAIKNEFDQLAKHILNEDDWHNILLWPIFREFRSSAIFLEAFKSHFDSEYYDDSKDKNNKD